MIKSHHTKPGASTKCVYSGAADTENHVEYLQRRKHNDDPRTSKTIRKPKGGKSYKQLELLLPTM